MTRDEQTPKSAGASPAGDRKIRRWRLDDLMGDAREAIIEHDGQEYRLRVTANEKLILTK